MIMIAESKCGTSYWGRDIHFTLTCVLDSVRCLASLYVKSMPTLLHAVAWWIDLEWCTCNSGMGLQRLLKRRREERREGERERDRV